MENPKTSRTMRQMKFCMTSKKLYLLHAAKESCLPSELLGFWLGKGRANSAVTMHPRTHLSAERFRFPWRSTTSEPFWTNRDKKSLV